MTTGAAVATMTDAADTTAPPASGTVKVWDLVVRVGHWLLLAAVATALITRGEPETIHQFAGYVIVGWIVVRLFWGIAGPPSARFESFLTAPGRAVGYLVDLVRGRAKRHVGHSPAGGWMVVALMVALSGSALTGLAMENRVPPPALLAPVLGAGDAYEAEEAFEVGEGGERGESPWEEVHEAFANLVLLLVILHVAGVALASMAHRENLAQAMVTGRKRAPDGEA